MGVLVGYLSCHTHHLGFSLLCRDRLLIECNGRVCSTSLLLYFDGETVDFFLVKSFFLRVEELEAVQRGICWGLCRTQRRRCTSKRRLILTVRHAWAGNLPTLRRSWRTRRWVKDYKAAMNKLVHPDPSDDWVFVSKQGQMGI